MRGAAGVGTLKLLRCPRSVAPNLVTLPSMSLIQFAPFDVLGLANVFGVALEFAPKGSGVVHLQADVSPAAAGMTNDECRIRSPDRKLDFR
jgi:hypothetical protein